MSKTTDLALLQLEQYDTERYLVSRKNVLKSGLEKRIVWTTRLKLTSWMANFIGIVGANILIASVVTLIEKMIWLRVQTRILQLKKNGLKVVAIAGSYGKTSVKHYAYELLRRKYRVAATPASFNTVMGIAKCLEYEVDERTEIFLVEVGAYHTGDITYLLEMVNPDIGVLTGIARQHLERFGSFENIVQAKLEIAVYMSERNKSLIANESDSTVKENVEKLGLTPVWYRGENRKEINLDGGRKIARALGMNDAEIAKITVSDPQSRFEMTTERYGMKVIDDSFSSNDKGFIDAINYLSKEKDYTRILVTPGLVELGSESNKLHKELGEMIVGEVDYVILVGRNDRTKSLELGMGGKVKVVYIEKTLEFMQVVKALKLKKEPLVLLENDVTENY